MSTYETDNKTHEWATLERENFTYSCNCRGPQPGHKLCPCAEHAKSVNDSLISAPYVSRIKELEAEVEKLKAKKK